MLFETPQLDLEDQGVLAELEGLRDSLAGVLRTPRRWSGGLRRTSQARAIQGSNTIEGYVVTDDDAMAAVDDEEPLSADERTWAEILGYRRVMKLILQSVGPGLIVDAQLLRMMHFMLLEHDLSVNPGQFRGGPIYVRRESDGNAVYEGPEADAAPELVESLAESLRATSESVMVRAAMAHLNLVMIHPFKDGNGRLARALQTLVLSQDKVLDPTFSSIEEWLGHNTTDYYDVLAATGQGGWHPDNDAHLWVKFNLRAHHMQAQTVRRRMDEADVLGGELLQLLDRRGLPERLYDPLFEAALGLRVRRSPYVKRAQVEERTASRDLRSLMNAELLESRGNTRGRYYIAAPGLREIHARSRASRQPMDDPYPELTAEIRARKEGRRA